MLAAARFQSRHAGDALTYICLDAPLRGTHDVAALCCSSCRSLVLGVRISSSLSERDLGRARRVTRPVAGAIDSGRGARLLAQRRRFVSEACSYWDSGGVLCAELGCCVVFGVSMWPRRKCLEPPTCRRHEYRKSRLQVGSASRRQSM
jgi:hypothetical protein